MGTVYLHIGTAKTGTSSLQRFFASNRKVFHKKGFDIPEMPFHFDDAADLRNAHFLSLWDDRSEPEGRWKRGFAKVKEALGAYENVILTDEQLWIMQIHDHFWERVKQELGPMGVRLHVIVYLRPQDEIAESHWNQRVKGRPKLEQTFSEFLAEGYDFFPLDYGKTIDHIAEQVGRDNLTVRAFERQQFTGGSLYADFLEVLGLGLTDEFKEPGHVSNIRLPENVVEIKRLVNSVDSYQKKDIPNFYWDAIRQAYGLGTMKNIPKHETGMFSPEERKAYMAEFAETNAHVAREYFGRENGTLFFGDVSTLPKWEPKEKEMLADIVRVFAGADTYLFKRQQELESKLEAVEKRLAELENSLPMRISRKISRNK